MASPPDPCSGRRSETRLICPDWPAPSHVRAVTTTRQGGKSAAPFDTFNLALGVGDDEAAVERNRARLATRLDLPGSPRWLRQVHGVAVTTSHGEDEPPIADVCVAGDPGQVCVVLTADCVPVLLCDRDGRRVAAAHGGWRGLAGGVIGAAVAAMGRAPRTLLAWMGPAIGRNAYEVGDDVRRAFLNRDRAARDAFVPSPAGRWLADLYALTRLELRRAGVESIYGGDANAYCTYTDANRFYSYRRDGDTGRMASLIWIEESSNRTCPPA